MIVAEIDGEVVGNCSFSQVGKKIRVRHRCSVGIALCQRAWGFVKCGTRPNAIRHEDGICDDDIIMVKQL